MAHSPSLVDMTSGSIIKKALIFAIPICVGNILQQLYSTVDTLVIGNYCDAAALAAVATSSQPLEILLCIFLGIGSGISILVSRPWEEMMESGWGGLPPRQYGFCISVRFLFLWWGCWQVPGF